MRSCRPPGIQSTGGNTGRWSAHPRSRPGRSYHQQGPQLPGGQPGPATQERQLQDDGDADDLRPGALDQRHRGRRGATGGQHVVDNQHPLTESYDLEYGTATIEVHQDAFAPGERVLIVDDVLATGGTAAATVTLIERAGAEVVGIAVILELAFLGGRARLAARELRSLLVV